MTKKEFKKELELLDKVIEKLQISDGNKAAFLGKTFSLGEKLKQVQNIDKDLEDELISTKFLLQETVSKILKEYNGIISKYFYAINDSNLVFKLARSLSAYNSSYDYSIFSAFNEYIEAFNEIIDKLKQEGIITEDLKANIGNMNSPEEENQFKNSISNVNKAFYNLDKLKKELANAHSDEDVKKVIKQMDSQLKVVNSTNRALERLKEKNGHIEPHQRSIKVTASQIKKVRNQTIVDTLYNSSLLNEEIDNLKKAYNRERNAKTSTELWRAKRDIKRAEREIYGIFGHHLTKRKAAKIDAAIAERNEIIKDAQSIFIDDNDTYRKTFNETMNKLEKIDKKIIGKRNAYYMYWHRSGLKKKSGYLVGGTTLTLPKQIIELSNIASATRR